jgi:hypothetical protein
MSYVPKGITGYDIDEKVKVFRNRPRWPKEFG